MNGFFMSVLGTVFLVLGLMSDHASVPYYGNIIMAQIWFAASILHKDRRP